ncbi:MAG: hypothetical protein ABJE47_25660 [bacterium]
MTLVGLTTLSVVACNAGRRGGESLDAKPLGNIVALEPVADSLPELWSAGLNNIFFAPVPPSLKQQLRVGDGWMSFEIAAVVQRDGLKTIYAARYKVAGSDQLHYVVDTTGELDFRGAKELSFVPHAKVLVANLAINVQSTAGINRRIPYQVLLSDDGYTYARIAEYRTGRVRVDGHDYAVKVRNRAGHPFYGTESGTVFWVDLNGDGRFAEQAEVTVGGVPKAAEQVLPLMPFQVGGRSLEIADIDAQGSRLIVRAPKNVLAAVEGFRAPAFTARLLSGDEYQFSKHSDKVVLIEFWSTECQFSDKVRNAANSLATSANNAGYTWIAVAKETDRGQVEKHLADHPMRATVTLSDSAAWATYNPEGVTPLFIVVDRTGVIRFRAQGASAMDAVTAKVNQLLAPASAP